MSTLPLNGRQIPDNAILDLNGRQVYLGNAFITGTQSGSIGATTETPYVLIQNPASSKTSMIVYAKKHSVITTTSAIATFRYYGNPTVTAAGTAMTPLNLRANANSPSSAMTVTSSPTVSANGTFIADIATTNSGAPTVSMIVNIIDPGNSVLVTCTASSGTAPVAWEWVWYELPYGTGL